MITVLKYTKYPKEGALIATFNMQVDFPGWGLMYFNDMKLFMKNGARWVYFPDRSYVKDDKTQYYSLCGFVTREDSDARQPMILKAIEAFCQAQSPSALSNPQKQASEPKKPQQTQNRYEKEDDNLPF
jgi:hypothetical protein